jgi:putative MFS transporter
VNDVLAAWRRLRPEHRFLLLVLGGASFFDGYDISIKILALTQIREDFGLTSAAASGLFAVIYLGALPAVYLTRKADRVGRRQMLVLSVFGYMVFSGLTAIAPNEGWFAGFQFFQQLFVVAESAIVWTMAAEELPAESRGFGFGILAMNSALGTGFAAILYGGILEPMGLSWRWLYVVGIPPLLFVAYLRRRLPESKRFIEARDSGRLAERWHAILHPSVRKWLILVVLTTFLLQLVEQATAFTIDFLQTDRGISASTANFMLIAAGLPGIPIMVVAGNLSDRYGRRLVGCGFAIFSIIGGAGFFWLPGGVPVLLPCMMLTIVGQLGSWPTLQTYASELFPTALRGQAGSWSNSAAVLGRSASLGLASLLLLHFSQSATVLFLGIGPLVALVLIAVAFPDTHGRELEDITGEVAAAEGVAVAVSHP